MRFGMRITPRAIVLPLFVLLALGPLGTTVAHGQARSISISEALDMYEKGDPEVADALSNIGPAVLNGQMLGDLSEFGPAWIKAAGPDKVDHRRLVIASFVLDTLARQRAAGNGVPSDLIDWSADKLRDTRAPLAAERLWHLAAIELLESGGSAGGLGTEIMHARQRFPDEPRFLLADAWLDQARNMTAATDLNAMRQAQARGGNAMIQPQAFSAIASRYVASWASSSSYGNSGFYDPSFDVTYPGYGVDQFGNPVGYPRLGSSTPGGRTITTARMPSFGTVPGYSQPLLIPSPVADFELVTPRNIWTTPEANTSVPGSVRSKYERAFAIPALAPEAALRLGYLDLVSGKLDAALASFSQVTSFTSDNDLVYLADLFSGWSQERLHHMSDAEMSYRSALKIIPNAKTATTSLAAILQAEGKLDEAQAVVDASLTQPSGDDAWLRFGQSDLIPPSDLIQQLRHGWQ